MYTADFWKDALERVVVTFAQFLLVLGGADGADFVNMDFNQLIALAAAGALAALLKAIVALKATNGNSASLTVENVEAR